MNINEALKRINQNAGLLASGSITEIDRDILLHDLRSLYIIAKGNAVFTIAENEQPVNIAPETTNAAIINEETVAVTIANHAAVVEETIETIIPQPEKTIVADESIIVPQPAPVNQTKAKSGLLNDIFAGEERSLNEKLSADKRPAINDNLGRKDLKSMIDFNKQFVLTNELFGGDSHAFQTAIRHINDAPNIESAFEYIKTELLPKYKWNNDMQSARLFDKLVRQKFGLQ